MIAVFDLQKLFGHIAPTLWERSAKQHNANAREYGINILGGKPLDPSGQYAQMSMDVSGASRASVLEFCRFSHVVSVSVQKSDLSVYLSDMVLDLVVANWPQFQPDLTNIPPDEIVTTFNQIGRSILAYRPPVDKKEVDPFKREETEEEKRHREINDQVWLELQQAETAREAAEAKLLAADPWNMNF